MARFGRAPVVPASKQVSRVDLLATRLGAYHGGFLRRGQSWFCTTGLPSNIIIEVDEMLFHLHKLPLISRSGRISKLVAEATSSDDDDDDDDDDDGNGEPDQSRRMRLHRICRVQMHGMPGGPETFELVAKFCYREKVVFSAGNVAALRCAAEYLQMTEEYGASNLIALTESFLSNVIVRSWKDSIKTLKRCEKLLPLAEELLIVGKCVDSIATKVRAEPNLYGWRGTDHKGSLLSSPRGKLPWNGYRATVSSKNVHVDWWYEDVSILNLPLFKCVVHSLEEKGLKPEDLAGVLMYYARKAIPGMHRRQEGSNGKLHLASSVVSPCSAEQLFVIETIESLLPDEEGMLTTVFLSALLKVAMILNASESCRENLERRLGAQLELATVDDILIPNYADAAETLYDVECVLRIVRHFFNTRKVLVLRGGDAYQARLPRAFSSPATLVITVAKLMDAYLAEIAADVNLKPAKFRTILEVLPPDARVLDDGIYRAVDIFLKAHPWVEEAEVDALCNMFSCKKLTQQACEHAAQSKRLPLRVVAEVLFLEQAQLRAAFANAFGAATLPISAATSLSSSGNAMAGGRRLSFHMGSEESQLSEPSEVELRAGMTGLWHRVAELERECVYLRSRLGRKGTGWASFLSRVGCLMQSSSSYAQQRSRSFSASSPPRVRAHYH